IPLLCFFLFNVTATTEIYTLSLHDALPIYALKTPVHQDTNTSSLRSDVCPEPENSAPATQSPSVIDLPATQGQSVSITEAHIARSEEHTSELQSRENLVCRLLLEKKNKKNK